MNDVLHLCIIIHYYRVHWDNYLNTSEFIRILRLLISVKISNSLLKFQYCKTKANIHLDSCISTTDSQKWPHLKKCSFISWFGLKAVICSRMFITTLFSPLSYNFNDCLSIDQTVQSGMASPQMQACLCHLSSGGPCNILVDFWDSGFIFLYSLPEMCPHPQEEQH